MLSVLKKKGLTSPSTYRMVGSSPNFCAFLGSCYKGAVLDLGAKRDPNLENYPCQKKMALNPKP